MQNWQIKLRYVEYTPKNLIISCMVRIYVATSY